MKSGRHTTVVLKVTYLTFSLCIVDVTLNIYNISHIDFKSSHLYLTINFNQHLKVLCLGTHLADRYFKYIDQCNYINWVKLPYTKIWYLSNLKIINSIFIAERNDAENFTSGLIISQALKCKQYEILKYYWLESSTKPTWWWRLRF